MPPVLLTCPECAATLKAGAPPAGRKVRCPRCGTAFQARPRPARSREPDEEEIAPVSPPRRKRPGSRRDNTLLLALGIGGGLILLLALVGGAAVWLYSTSGGPRGLIVGTWESTDQPSAGTIEFQRDGTLICQPETGVSLSLQYRFLDDRTVEVEIANPFRQEQQRVAGRLPSGQQVQAPEKLRGTFTIIKLTRTELITHSSTEGDKHFRRSR